jgi:hypothetical protein
MEAIDAYNKGYITIEANSLNSYLETMLSVKNRHTRNLELDFSTLGLIPRSGSAQRIGLAYIKSKGVGNYIKRIPSGRICSIVFSSRCLDKERKPPKTGSRYDIIRQKIPKYIYKALRSSESQDEIWAITENSHNSSDWKALDHRNIQDSFDEWIVVIESYIQLCDYSHIHEELFCSDLLFFWNNFINFFYTNRRHLLHSQIERFERVKPVVEVLIITKHF